MTARLPLRRIDRGGEGGGGDPRRFAVGAGQIEDIGQRELDIDDRRVVRRQPLQRGAVPPGSGTWRHVGDGVARRGERLRCGTVVSGGRGEHVPGDLDDVGRAPRASGRRGRRDTTVQPAAGRRADVVVDGIPHERMGEAVVAVDGDEDPRPFERAERPRAADLVETRHRCHQTEAAGRDRADDGRGAGDRSRIRLETEDTVQDRSRQPCRQGRMVPAGRVDPPVVHHEIARPLHRVEQLDGEQRRAAGPVAEQVHQTRRRLVSGPRADQLDELVIEQWAERQQVGGALVTQSCDGGVDTGGERWRRARRRDDEDPLAPNGPHQVEHGGRRLGVGVVEVVDADDHGRPERPALHEPLHQLRELAGGGLAGLPCEGGMQRRRGGEQRRVALLGQQILERQAHGGTRDHGVDAVSGDDDRAEATVLGFGDRRGEERGLADARLAGDDDRHRPPDAGAGQRIGHDRPLVHPPDEALAHRRSFRWRRPST